MFQVVRNQNIEIEENNTTSLSSGNNIPEVTTNIVKEKLIVVFIWFVMLMLLLSFITIVVFSFCEKECPQIITHVLTFTLSSLISYMLGINKQKLK